MLSGGKIIEFVDQVPGLIEPIGITVDITRLQNAVSEVFTKVGFNEAFAFTNPRNQISFNLNHPTKIPSTVKNIHYGVLATSEDNLVDFGLGCKDFTVLDPLVVGTYIEEVVSIVANWHNSNKLHKGTINRVHSAILGNSAGFQFHSDQHTTIRYHIALSTNDLSYMMSIVNNKVKATNIPVDGRVWLLDTRVLHTAMNLAPNRYNEKDRIRNHLIISVSQ